MGLGSKAVERKSERQFGLTATLFTLIGLIVPVTIGLLVALHDFDGLYGQDAYAYFDYATVALVEEPFPPPFYWPPGYPILILAMTYVVGNGPQAGQLVSILSGGLTVVFTMLLARELDDKCTMMIPFVAGLVLACVGQLWQSSAVVMADTSALAAANLGIWALVRYSNRVKEGNPQSYWLMLAAAALAYAAITRWVFGLLVPVGVFYLLWHLNRESVSTVRYHAVFAMMILFAVLGAVLVPAFFRGNTFGGSFQNHLPIWNLANAFRHVFTNPDGYLTYRLPNGLYYGIMPARTFYFTPLLAAFLLPGLWTLIRNRMLKASVILLGWIGVMYLFLIGNPWQNVRFGLSFAPPFAILIAIGITMIWQWLYQLRLITGLIVCIGLVWAGISGIDLTQDFIERKQQDLATAQWVESQLPSDAQVITLGLTLTLQYYTQLEVYEIYTLSTDDLAALTASDWPQYLLLDVRNVETQWRDSSPAENFHWLQTHFNLILVGDYGSYTLFRIETS